MTEHSLLQDFIAETGEHLEQTERNLLRLEQRPEDARVLNEIFRAIHTIKGSAEYLGLERIAELSHKLENLLDLLRRGERALDGEGVDLLIGVNDRIGQLVDDLSRHQRERASIDDLVARIGSYTGHAGPISAEQAAGGPEPEGDGEVFGDEYDEELFGIFIGQLKEGLEALWGEARNLLADPSVEAALARYEDRLGTLRSSANYMGYDKLKQIYDQWSRAVAEAGGRLSGGQSFDWDGFVQGMTADYIGQVKALFPKVAALTALEQHVRGQEVPAATETPAMPVQEQEEVETATASTGDTGLLEEFIVEAAEHLEEAERNLLLLSQHPGDIDTLNELFRAVHTIKGSSEYLGMTRIAELSHKLESLLDLLRRGQKVVDPATADLLMVANDRIGMLVHDLAHHGREQSAIDDLVAGIDAFMQSAPSAPVAPAVPPEPAPAGTLDAGAAATVYHEAYDGQLFAIFMAQFNEGLGALAMAAGQVGSGEAARAIVARCRPWLARLRSSANYMEYDELRGFYDAWMHTMDDSLERMPAHAEAAWQDDFRRMMQDNMDKARGFFATADTVAPVQTPDREAQTPTTDEQSLLDRLERAFDTKIELSANTAAAGSRQEMVDELLSGDDGLEALPVIGGDGPVARPPAGGALEGGDIESLLFSDAGGEKIPRKPMMPKPLVRMTEGPGDLLEEDDRRAVYVPGRRRTDRFRDRLLKQSIRVEAAKIDMLMNQVGELVVNRAGFNQLFSEMREFQLLIKQTQKLSPKEMQIVKDLTNRINEATVSLGRVTSELQENVMKVRMMPIAQLFSRYPRVVHDLVRNTDKKVDLDIHGEETELDRMVIEQIADPLVHIIRNAVDHGIEPVPERQRRGKPETGTLRLEAYHEGNYVVIEVSDDGRGIDIEQIKARALAKEFVQAGELEAMTGDQVLALIMRPGFSTVDEVTHTSGRGVGMDVVKDHIDKLNGTIEIVSTPGRSTLFRIRIPLTLAIIQALLVRVAGERFTIPLSAVDETIRIHRNEISTIEGLEIYYLRETTLPLIRLAQVFKMQGARPDARELFVVVVSTGSRQVGLIVDGLEGRQEVVIKPLEDYLQEQSGFSGATILGDGSISLILDVSDLVHLAIEQHARKMRATAI
jgi:two-component system, chemotaxis family, sensor kinase CheA